MNKDIVKYSDFRKRYIPNDKIGTGNVDDYLDLVLGLAENNIVAPVEYCIGGKCSNGLVVGQHGSGVSNFIRQMISSLVLEYDLDDLRLNLVDLDGEEFADYKNENSLSSIDVADSSTGVVHILNDIINKLDMRLGLFDSEDADCFTEYNASIKLKGEQCDCIPRTLVVINGFSYMFDNENKDVIESKLKHILKISNVCGYHFLFVEQRDIDSIPKVIDDNCIFRVAFKCDATTSKLVLGVNYASKLDYSGGWLYACEGGKQQSMRMICRAPLITYDDVCNCIKDAKRHCECSRYKE